MTDAAMTTHTSITDLLGLNIVLFYDVYATIAQIIEERNKKS